MNPFAQNIGIYYKHLVWAKRFLDDFIKDIKDYDVIKYRTHNGIVLKDNTIIRIIPCNGSARCYRFTSAYIQEGIEKKIYCEIIAPKITGENVFVIKDYSEIPTKRGIKAQEFYKGGY